MVLELSKSTRVGRRFIGGWVLILKGVVSVGNSKAKAFSYCQSFLPTTENWAGKQAAFSAQKSPVLLTIRDAGMKS